MKRLLLLINFILALLLTGCVIPAKGREEKTTEEIVLAASSGTDPYDDINQYIKEATPGNAAKKKSGSVSNSESSFNYSDIPEYSGEPYIVVNNDRPYFTEEMLTTDCYQDYGTLDELGRTPATTIVTCYEELPSGERGEIGHIKPSGFKQKKYPGIVDSDPPYLYNRAHLGMWAMLGDKSNVPENLISGSRYFNTESMLPNETIVLNYIKESKQHILYRVTPIYIEDDLVARGVLMEAMSIEDKGESLSLCRWAYNVQPGIKIDYKTGESELEK